MGGLAVLLIIAAYIGIAYAVIRAIKPEKWKIVAVVAVVLIPTADAAVGRFYLTYLCSAEGGLRIYRAVEGSDGLLMADNSPSVGWIKQYGFSFGEGDPMPTDSKGIVVNRISLQNGQVIVEQKVPPKSKYRSRFVTHQEKLSLSRSTAVVEAIESGEILAEFRRFYFHGGWAERLLGQFSDSGPGTDAKCAVWQPEIARRESILGAFKLKK